MKDTRDLEVKRDELKEFLVDDFNYIFEKEIKYQGETYLYKY